MLVCAKTPKSQIFLAWPNSDILEDLKAFLIEELKRLRKDNKDISKIIAAVEKTYPTYLILIDCWTKKKKTEINALETGI